MKRIFGLGPAHGLLVPGQAQNTRYIFFTPDTLRPSNLVIPFQMALRAALARTRLGTSTVRVPISRSAPLRVVARRPYSAGAQQPGNNKPSIAAMAAVASLGFAAYYTLVKSREGQRMYLTRHMRCLCRKK